MIHFQTINSKSHSLEQREQLFATFTFDESTPHIFLQTCNRMEIYWGEGKVPEETIRHIYRVASGLESSLLGERFIQGQLKSAYQDACKKYKLSSGLHRLFQSAMHTGKNVRTRTRISTGAVSHSQATVDLIKRNQEKKGECTIGLVGINKLTADILKFLSTKDLSKVYICNRTHSKALDFAGRYGCECLPFSDLRQLVSICDILICATSAPHSILHREDITTDKSLTIFDLAFPRDVDSSVDQLSQVEVYNLEMIEKEVQQNLEVRFSEVEKAEQIIDEEIKRFNEWQSYLSEEKQTECKRPECKRIKNKQTASQS